MRSSLSNLSLIFRRLHFSVALSIARPAFSKRPRGIDGVLGILNALVDLLAGLFGRSLRLTTGKEK